MKTKNLIQEYWYANHNPKKENTVFGVYVNCPVVKCSDGFEMSVQASYGHYCSPRDYLEGGDYSTWEVGFPSLVEDLLMPFAEDVYNPTDTVYGYVPTDIINKVIEKHGGIKK